MAALVATKQKKKKNKARHAKAPKVLQMNRNSNKLKKCNKPTLLAFDSELQLASIAVALHEETK